MPDFGLALIPFVTIVAALVTVPWRIASMIVLSVATSAASRLIIFEGTSIIVSFVVALASAAIAAVTMVIRH